MTNIKHNGLAVTWQIKKSTQSTQKIESADASIYALFRVAGHEPQLTLVNQTTNAHSSYCVMFVLDGQHQLSFNKVSSALVSGDVLIWMSTVPISLQCDSNFQALLLLSPTLEFEKKWSELIPANRCSKLKQHNALTSLGRRLLENIWQQHRTLSIDELKAVVESVLGLLCSGQRLPPGSAADIKDIYSKMSDYIDHELADSSLGPQKISEHFGCSLRSIHLIFSKHAKTVSSEIRNRRLECARIMLLQQDNTFSISTIAFKFGFSDAAHFSRLFKERFGSTPREYRNSSA